MSEGIATISQHIDVETAMTYRVSPAPLSDEEIIMLGPLKRLCRATKRRRTMPTGAMTAKSAALAPEENGRMNSRGAIRQPIASRDMYVEAVMIDDHALLSAISG